MALSHFTLPGDEEEGDVVVDDDDDEEIVVVVDVDDEDDDIIIIISSVIVITLKAYFWGFVVCTCGKDFTALSPFSILCLRNPCNAVQRKTTVQFNASIMFEIQCIISLLMSQYSALHVLQ